jgi:hypothetical protein
MTNTNPCYQFRLPLGQLVGITISDEQGFVIGRANHSTGEDSYLLRYVAADGRACEAWWGDSALTPLPHDRARYSSTD